MKRLVEVQSDYLLDGGSAKERRTRTGSGGRLLGEGREGHYMYPRALGNNRATFLSLIPLFSFIYSPYRPGPRPPPPPFHTRLVPCVARHSLVPSRNRSVFLIFVLSSLVSAMTGVPPRPPQSLTTPDELAPLRSGRAPVRCRAQSWSCAAVSVRVSGADEVGSAGEWKSALKLCLAGARPGEEAGAEGAGRASSCRPARLVTRLAR